MRLHIYAIVCYKPNPSQYPGRHRAVMRPRPARAEMRQPTRRHTAIHAAFVTKNARRHATFARLSLRMPCVCPRHAAHDDVGGSARTFECAHDCTSPKRTSQSVGDIFIKPQNELLAACGVHIRCPSVIFLVYLEVGAHHFVGAPTADANMPMNRSELCSSLLVLIGGREKNPARQSRLPPARSIAICEWVIPPPHELRTMSLPPGSSSLRSGPTIWMPDNEKDRSPPAPLRVKLW